MVKYLNLVMSRKGRKIEDFLKNCSCQSSSPFSPEEYFTLTKTLPWVSQKGPSKDQNINNRPELFKWDLAIILIFCYFQTQRYTKKFPKKEAWNSLSIENTDEKIKLIPQISFSLKTLVSYSCYILTGSLILLRY